MNHQKTSIVHRQLTIIHPKGFTLIELLVVMTIIVTFATFSTISFNNAKAKARDAKRKQDMKTMQTALYLYSKDNYGYFPACTGGFSIPQACYLSNITPNISPTYINVLPIEPGAKSAPNIPAALSGISYTYMAFDDNNDQTCNGSLTCNHFKVTACLEKLNDPERDVPTAVICSQMLNLASYTLSEPK